MSQISWPDEILFYNRAPDSCFTVEFSSLDRGFKESLYYSIPGKYSIFPRADVLSPSVPPQNNNKKKQSKKGKDQCPKRPLSVNPASADETLKDSPKEWSRLQEVLNPFETRK